jgi:hypothetical protein
MSFSIGYRTAFTPQTIQAAVPGQLRFGNADDSFDDEDDLSAFTVEEFLKATISNDGDDSFTPTASSSGVQEPLREPRKPPARPEPKPARNTDSEDPPARRRQPRAALPPAPSGMVRIRSGQTPNAPTPDPTPSPPARPKPAARKTTPPPPRITHNAPVDPPRKKKTVRNAMIATSVAAVAAIFGLPHLSQFDTDASAKPSTSHSASPSPGKNSPSQTTSPTSSATASSAQPSPSETLTPVDKANVMVKNILDKNAKIKIDKYSEAPSGGFKIVSDFTVTLNGESKQYHYVFDNSRSMAPSELTQKDGEVSIQYKNIVDATIKDPGDRVTDIVIETDGTPSPQTGLTADEKSNFLDTMGSILGKVMQAADAQHKRPKASPSPSGK